MASKPESSPLLDEIASLRRWRAEHYDPLLRRYLEAVASGATDVELANLAEELADEADDGESRWTALLHSENISDPAAHAIDDAATRWASGSDLWTALAEAHRQRWQSSVP